MLKLSLNNGSLLLGISEQEIEELKEGKVLGIDLGSPILVTEIAFFSGKDDDEMKKELKEHIMTALKK